MATKIIKELIGKTFTQVKRAERAGYYYGDNLQFLFENGDGYIFYHDQMCCEGVWIEDISGDLNDLVGSPIIMAEEVSECGEYDPSEIESNNYSYTWTFYKFATAKGYVTVRWYGESNGCYSEQADLYLKKGEEYICLESF